MLQDYSQEDYVLKIILLSFYVTVNSRSCILDHPPPLALYQTAKNLDLSKLEAFTYQKGNVSQKLNIFCEEEKHFGKKSKSWLPAFFSFPTMF